jgi:pantoate--beta-alanine ligase
MRTVRTVADMRAALAIARQAGRSIALVPTMGAFHEGHLSLIRAARASCDEVVVSLFVNPTQFQDPLDLAAYPRDERTDAALAAEMGADFLLAPPAAEVYRPGFATTVSVRELTDRLEGEHRGRAHFDGVATVVTKLLNVVHPHLAYFGQKDAQQVAVIKRLVHDLDLPVRIEVCPTVREPDGLAMSSRNVRLTSEERHRAPALHRSLVASRATVRAGERDAARVREAGLAELSRAGIVPDYLELVAPSTFAPVEVIDDDVLAVVAARLGSVRLIDNEAISVSPARRRRVRHSTAARAN